MNLLMRMRIAACVTAGFAAVVFGGCTKSKAPSVDPGIRPEIESSTLESPEPVVEPTTFATADEGVAAMIAAIRASDKEVLAGIFGIDYDEFVPSGEVDRADVEKFLAAYDESHKMITDTPGKAVLAVGADSWKFPIPLAESGGKWSFDLDAGRDQIAIRRIGRNELAVIQTTLAYYDAQKEYASRDRNGDGMLEYAQKVISTEGQKDGLYWPDEGDASPLGPLLADDAVPGEPYHGYRYRILAAQGPHAPGGARNYILGARMSGGFALIAWPAAYGETGITTFIVNHDGVVYEKDLGDDTEAAAAAIGVFDPDDTWKAVEPEA